MVESVSFSTVFVCRLCDFKTNNIRPYKEQKADYIEHLGQVHPNEKRPTFTEK